MVAFECCIANVKMEFADNLYRRSKVRFELADCEVKSTWLRVPKEKEKHSPFLSSLNQDEILRLVNVFYSQLAEQRMNVFSVVIDKRKLHDHTDAHIMHKKAYELLIERIENFMREVHPKHNALIVMDDTGRETNRTLAMKHAYFQREGGQHGRFDHIVEYPFFTDSKLSHGVQLADLCGYNIYRAFRNENFGYKFFEDMLPRFYISQKTTENKLDGLKVFPPDSALVSFANKGWNDYKKERLAPSSGTSR